jgi:hypothetical protein
MDICVSRIHPVSSGAGTRGIPPARNPLAIAVTKDAHAMAGESLRARGWSGIAPVVGMAPGAESGV